MTDFETQILLIQPINSEATSASVRIGQSHTLDAT